MNAVPRTSKKPKQVLPVQLVTALQRHWPWGHLPNCPTSGDGACCSLRVAPPFHLISAQVPFPEYSTWGRPTLHLHFSSLDFVLFYLCVSLIDRKSMLLYSVIHSTIIIIFRRSGPWACGIHKGPNKWGRGGLSPPCCSLQNSLAVGLPSKAQLLSRGLIYESWGFLQELWGLLSG